MRAMTKIGMLILVAMMAACGGMEEGWKDCPTVPAFNPAGAPRPDPDGLSTCR